MNTATNEIDNSEDVQSDTENAEGVNLDTSDIKGTKPKQCTTCSRPVKGHDGPTGKRCQFATSEEKQTKETGANDEVLRILVAQMTSLNANIESMIQKQDHLLRRQATQGHTPGVIDSPAMATPDTTQGPTAAEEPASTSEPGSLGVSQKLSTTAANGEFVNLADFLLKHDLAVPRDELEAVVVEGTIQFRPRKSRRSIDCFRTWLEAWNNFEQAVVQRQASVYTKLVEYRRFIQSCDNKYNWSAVAAYDVKFRAKLAETRSFAYDQIDSTIYVCTLDATSVKQSRKNCHRCRAPDHLIADCPFPADYAMAADEEKKTRRRAPQERWFYDNKEGCNNWQTGNCNYPSCRRAHVCKRCRGPEPAYRCPCFA